MQCSINFFRNGSWTLPFLGNSNKKASNFLKYRVKFVKYEVAEVFSGFILKVVFGKALLSVVVLKLL